MGFVVAVVTFTSSQRLEFLQWCTAVFFIYCEAWYIQECFTVFLLHSQHLNVCTKEKVSLHSFSPPLAVDLYVACYLVQSGQLPWSSLSHACAFWLQGLAFSELLPFLIMAAKLCYVSLKGRGYHVSNLPALLQQQQTSAFYQHKNLELNLFLTLLSRWITFTSICPPVATDLCLWKGDKWVSYPSSSADGFCCKEI